MKLTNRPSAELAGRVLKWSAWAPSEATLTRAVRPVCRSRSKTSSTPLLSPGTRPLADERLPGEMALQPHTQAGLHRTRNSDAKVDDGNG